MSKEKFTKKTKTLSGEMVYENARYLNEDNPWDEWQHMPEYDVMGDNCFLELEITVEDDSYIPELVKMLEQNITPKTKSIWFPKLEISDYSQICYRSESIDPRNQPKHPIYIPSKGRWDVRMTSDSLIEMQVPHYMIVEQHQLAEYQRCTDPKWVTLLVLPERYFDEYESCDNLGRTKSLGPGPARNFAWDHAISIGATWHWVMDDNHNGFFRHLGEKRIPCKSGAMFRAMEDHSERYENCYMSGPNYRFFVIPQSKRPPFNQNCRIYSCNLIRNDIPFRWRGRYNEDTIISLDILKAGYCTIQYNAFTSGKIVTQALGGGNTAEFYANEGTHPKSQMLVDVHPDVSSVVWKFNRWHHHVDYNPYKKLRLNAKDTFDVNPNVEYGMVYSEGDANGIL